MLGPLVVESMRNLAGWGWVVESKWTNHPGSAPSPRTPRGAARTSSSLELRQKSELPSYDWPQCMGDVGLCFPVKQKEVEGDHGASLWRQAPGRCKGTWYRQKSCPLQPSPTLWSKSSAGSAGRALVPCSGLWVGRLDRLYTEAWQPLLCWFPETQWWPCGPTAVALAITSPGES